MIILLTNLETGTSIAFLTLMSFQQYAKDRIYPFTQLKEPEEIEDKGKTELMNVFMRKTSRSEAVYVFNAIAENYGYAAENITTYK